MALTYPWFLLGLLAVAIPIAIHLFELRRPQRVLFTNVSFIREVKLVTARQRQLKHLLVLLTRIGFLVSLALMFCQPFLPAPQQAAEQGNQVQVLVDTTPSMQAQSGEEQPNFERAVKEARNLTNAYSGATHFQLVNGPRGPLTAAAYRTATDQLGISGRSAAVNSSLNKVSAAGNRNKGQLFVFSDFQKNSFSMESLAKLGDQQVFLVPVAGQAARNVYVDSVLLDDAFVRTGGDITLRIRLRNGGNVTAPECRVKLFVGDRQAAAYQTVVAAGGDVTTPVRVRLDENALRQCRVELEDYPVTFDNTYYFTLQPSPQIRVLDLATEEPATQRLYRNEPIFAYTWNRPQSVNYPLLTAANLVVVQSLPKIEPGLGERMRQVVARGGTVVIVPPTDAAGRGSYTQLFRELGVGAVQWEPVPAGAPALQDVALPGAQNPFFRDVFAQQSRQVVMPKVAPVLRWSRSGTDVLRLRTGDGYLAGFPSGKGMVYVFSAPFKGGYSDFTSHALFVPVMYRLAMQSARNDQRPAYRLNEGTVTLAVGDATGGEQIFKLVKDSLTFIPSQRLQMAELRFDVPPGMHESGFYQLTRNGRRVTTLAFNFDKQESELAHYSAPELRTLIGPDRPNLHVYDAADQSVAAQYKAERVGTPLWQYCLWAALTCLLAEVLLLRFAGQRTTRPPVVVVAA